VRGREGMGEEGTGGEGSVVQSKKILKIDPGVRSGKFCCTAYVVAFAHCVLLRLFHAQHRDAL